MEGPDYSGNGLNSLPNSLLAHFGLSARGPPLKFELGLSSRRVALVLLDGLGFSLFSRVAGSFAGRFRGVYRISTVFPSTTASALTTISTGLTPCQHGVVAWSFYLKEAGAVVDALHMSPMLGERDGLHNAGYDLKALFNAPSIFADMAKVGMKARVFLPRGLNGGISRILYDGAETFDYVSHHDALINAGRFLRQNDAAMAYVYIPTVDSAEHKYGPRSEEAAAIAEGVLGDVLRLADRHLQDVDVLITADHGHEEISRNEDLTKDPDLLRALEIPPYGDPRSLHVRTSAERRELEAILAKHGEFQLLSREEAVRAGLLGPCEGGFVDRIGDYLALPGRGLAALYLYKRRNEDPLKFKGHHGGLSEDELYVPLIIV